MSLDSQSSPIFHRGLLGSLRDPKASATCMSWGGAHYRSFDRKHFHFLGSCTYVLATSTDGTWAVYISRVCDGTGHCSKVQHTAMLQFRVDCSPLILAQISETTNKMLPSNILQYYTGASDATCKRQVREVWVGLLKITVRVIVQKLLF